MKIKNIKVTRAKEFLLLVIGAFQPISVDELFYYLNRGFNDGDILFTHEAIHKFCIQKMKSNHLIKVARNPDIFSLTAKGNLFFSTQDRRIRDKFRFFLLKSSHYSKVRLSREDIANRSGGVSPSSCVMSIIKGSEPKGNECSVPIIRCLWARISKQLVNQTGSSQTSRDSYNKYLPLLSFFNEQQLVVAMGVEKDSLKINFKTIGLMLGISPQLLFWISNNPEKYYNNFTIKKKGGGERTIESPRLFLKIIQQFLNDYFLFELPQHDCVHSFRIEHSIVSHAKLHTGKKYVANIDIEDFFGSVSHSLVINHLQKCGADEVAAKCITRLCTKDGALPQGAPTSPTISNSILFDFDERINAKCKELGLTYSRYADDITISGQDRKEITRMIKLASKLLENKYRLKLNNKKTRIASKFSQQRVTGVVVNEGVRPPRVFRRKIRAEFHNAKKKGEITKKEERHLRGYISYLSSYPDIRKNKEIEQYIETLKNVKITEQKPSGKIYNFLRDLFSKD